MSIFNLQAPTPSTKPSLFGSLNTNPTASASQPAQTSSLFGGSVSAGANTSNTGGSSLFDRIKPPDNASQTQQAGNIFGNTNAQTNQSTSTGGNIFGNLGGGNASQPTQQNNPTSSLFGGSLTQPAQGNTGTSNIFGASTQQSGNAAGNIFGNAAAGQQQTGGGGLFGSSMQQNPGGGIFGASTQTQQGQQNQLAQSQQNLLAQSQQMILNQRDLSARPQSTPSAISLAATKWNPLSPLSPFTTYLYNTVAPSTAPFYGPSPRDDPSAWETALSQKPTENSVPVGVRGFFELGQRMLGQHQCLEMLRGRLWEISNGLEALLRRHNLDISIRAEEAKKRHVALSRRCLSLAAKTQLMRNRGFGLEKSEEEVRKKLAIVERGVMDLGVQGRAEEIWARMVEVRERGRELEKEMEKKVGDAGATGSKPEALGEEVLAKVRKILEDYSAQISHLDKELARLRKDLEEWQKEQR